MGKRKVDRLILIFDADSGRVSAFFDSVRKALALPSCSLCALTHGLAGERPEWIDVKRRIGVPVDYLHRDELSGKIADVARGCLPCIVAVSGNEPVLLAGPAAILAFDGSIPKLETYLFEKTAELGFGMEPVARS